MSEQIKKPSKVHRTVEQGYSDAANPSRATLSTRKKIQSEGEKISRMTSLAWFYRDRPICLPTH